MSGVRPDVTAIFNFANNIRDPGLVSLGLGRIVALHRHSSTLYQMH
jgi:hypothetical protein